MKTFTIKSLSKFSILCVITFLSGLSVMSSAHAREWDHDGDRGGWHGREHDGWNDHDRISLSFGFGGGYRNNYYRPYYPAYYGYPYYPPAPVYYAPAPTTVIYTEPARVIYETPHTAVITRSVYPSNIIATQTSETFIDGAGRQCREYQSVTGSGIACLQPDGAWRIVQ